MPMTYEERNALLEEIALKLVGVFGEGKSNMGLRHHSCGSCDLQDYERSEISGRNEGLEAAAKLIRGMKVKPPLDVMT